MGRAARSALKSASESRAATYWRFLHDNESASVQMVDKPSRHDPRHHLGYVMLPAPALKAQREGERLGEVCGIGRFQGFRRVGHAATVARQ
jgi:hypothetical protein